MTRQNEKKDMFPLLERCLVFKASSPFKSRLRWDVIWRRASIIRHLRFLTLKTGIDRCNLMTLNALGVIITKHYLYLQIWHFVIYIRFRTCYPKNVFTFDLTHKLSFTSAYFNHPTNQLKISYSLFKIRGKHTYIHNNKMTLSKSYRMKNQILINAMHNFNIHQYLQSQCTFIIATLFIAINIFH